MKNIFVTPRRSTLTNIEESDEEAAGFWQGLWHGCTLPITFLMSLFNEEIGVYETRNNGGWYNFGFLFGLMMIFGGGKGGQQWGGIERKEVED